jgi:hypothetical protein
MTNQLDLLSYTPTPEEQGPPPKLSLILLEQIAAPAFYHRVAVMMILDSRLSRKRKQEAMTRLHRIQATAKAKLSALSPAPTRAESPD